MERGIGYVEGGGGRIWDGTEVACAAYLPTFTFLSLDFCISTHFVLHWLSACSNSMKIKCLQKCMNSVPKNLPRTPVLFPFLSLSLSTPIPHTYKPLKLKYSTKEGSEKKAKVRLAAEAKHWEKGRKKGEQETGGPLPLPQSSSREHTPTGHSKKHCAWAQVGPSLPAWMQLKR